jgi:signal peptidase II
MGSTPILGTLFFLIMRKYSGYLVLVLSVIAMDHASKLLTHFYLGGSGKTISVLGNFLEIHYLLNEGMAFGISLGSKYGKLLLTFGRIFLSCLIIKHIKSLIDNSSPKGGVVAWCLVIAGAIGNSIDGIFYGFLLNNASPSAPTKWFYGKVIDMIAVDTSFFYKLLNLAPWVKKFDIVPRYPVFNIADVSITVGVAMLVIVDLLYKKEGPIGKTSES